MINKDVRIVNIRSSQYPVLLRHISNPPPNLYVRGDISLLQNENKKIAVVGTRKPNHYGVKCTEFVCTYLCEMNVIIVSGMAIGIDTIAHSICIEHNVKTIAVLGTGVDLPYPRQNEKLYWEIIDSGGLIVSEFMPGTTAYKGSFSRRNRIVSGLCNATIVTQGGKHSGTLVTAKYSQNQGRDTATMPGPLFSDLSEASHILLKQGAALLTTKQDIADFVGFDLPRKNIRSQQMIDQMEGLEYEVYTLLQKQDMYPEQISVALQKPIPEVLQLLTTLEIKTAVAKNLQGQYSLVYL